MILTPEELVKGNRPKQKKRVDKTTKYISQDIYNKKLIAFKNKLTSLVCYLNGVSVSSLKFTTDILGCKRIDNSSTFSELSSLDYSKENRISTTEFAKKYTSLVLLHLTDVIDVIIPSITITKHSGYQMECLKLHEMDKVVTSLVKKVSSRGDYSDELIALLRYQVYTSDNSDCKKYNRHVVEALQMLKRNIGTVDVTSMNITMTDGDILQTLNQLACNIILLSSDIKKYCPVYKDVKDYNINYDPSPILQSLGEGLMEANKNRESGTPFLFTSFLEARPLIKTGRDETTKEINYSVLVFAFIAFMLNAKNTYDYISKIIY